MGIELSLSNALWLLHDISLDIVHDDDKDLSPRQLTILLTVYLETPPHTVRGLAEKLQVSKPVITRALDAMSVAGLLKRRRDNEDKRNVLVQRTVAGALYLEGLAEIVQNRAADLRI